MSTELRAAIQALLARLELRPAPSEREIELIAAHAAAVLKAPRELHLTSLADLDEFVDRHIGEALQGAALVDPAASGVLLDLGSGNGYPGLPLAIVRPGLVPVLAESTPGKALFLGRLAERILPRARVIQRHIQGSRDVEDLGPLRLLVCRAMGGWERMIPRLASSLAPEGEVLIWAGEDAARVAARAAWRRLELRERRSLAGRRRSWIWRFGLKGGVFGMDGSGIEP